MTMEQLARILDLRGEREKKETNPFQVTVTWESSITCSFYHILSHQIKLNANGYT